MTLTASRPSPSRPRQIVVPPAPVPRPTAPGPISLLRTLQRNPLETWTKAHFERPILTGRGLLGIGAVVNDPGAIRRVLLDNAANYRKDALQKRVLNSGLSNGLLTSEDEQWRMQRRALAPLFTPRIVASFAPAMARNAAGLAERWARLPPGETLDVQEAMARVTLESSARRSSPTAWSATRPSSLTR